MAARGRKPKYETHVKRRLDDVKRWAAAGATEAEICAALGVSVSSFNLYKTQYSELTDTLRAGRQTVYKGEKHDTKAVGEKMVQRRGRRLYRRGLLHAPE